MGNFIINLRFIIIIIIIIIIYCKLSFHSVAVVLTLVTNKNKYAETKQYKNTINTSTHIIKTPTQLSEHPHITKHTHTHTHYKTHTHTLQNKHSTRYTPNRIVTIQSSTLIMSL
jgi:hypothetical protein